MSISISNLSKSFHSKDSHKTVLSGLNLELERGSIFTLQGPNGCGKTTLLKIVSSLILPDSGRVQVSGFDISSQSGDSKSCLGFAFDAEKSFYQILSAYDNIRFFAALHGVSRRDFESRFETISKSLDIVDYKNVYLSHCSSGIRQRFALLRAYINNPTVVLLDEPTRSLDEQAQEKVLELIKHEAKASNRTTLIVAHDKLSVLYLGSRTGVLANGIIDEAKK